MLTMTDLQKVFTDKLIAEGSFDRAFTKACWIAYQEGFKNGTEATKISSALPHSDLPILHHNKEGT